MSRGEIWRNTNGCIIIIITIKQLPKKENMHDTTT